MAKSCIFYDPQFPYLPSDDIIISTSWGIKCDSSYKVLCTVLGTDQVLEKPLLLSLGKLETDY